jgi:serine/threonine protein kinase
MLYDTKGIGTYYIHHRCGVPIYIYKNRPLNNNTSFPRYSVIIDFGFAKYVPIPTKTFTLCGTPLYIPPEVILNRGHDGSADHWSFGVLIYEMLLGDTPFYTRGMEQLDLFRAIVKGRYTTTQIPGRRPLSEDAAAIIAGLIVKDPSQRLGSLAAGEEGILHHPWFAKHGMDMEQLRQKQYPAPTVPKIKDPLDSSNFDNWDHLEDKTKKKFPPLNREEKKLFEQF